MKPTAELQAELLRIREANGGVLTAEAIVRASAALDAPLHSRFEWDDEKAGHKHRLNQARNLVRVVRVEYISKRGEPESVRAFHSLPVAQSPSGRAYTPLSEIEGNDFLTAQLKRAMEIDWRAMQRRYRRFSEFTSLVARDLGLQEPTGTEPLSLGDEG